MKEKTVSSLSHLGVVEVGGHRHHGVLDGLAEVGLQGKRGERVVRKKRGPIENATPSPSLPLPSTLPHLGRLLHLGQHHGRDLFGGERLEVFADLDLWRGRKGKKKGMVDIVRIDRFFCANPLLPRPSPPLASYLHIRLLVHLHHLVRHQLHVALHLLVRVLAADQPLDVVDGALRVGRRLVLGGVADQALAVGEGDVGGSDAVALVVGHDLDAAALVDADARVGRAEVDADDGAQLLLLFGVFLVVAFLGFVGRGRQGEGAGGQGC